MLGYTQEMLVTANEARIEARDAGTTTTRRRQLTSEFSYSPEVRLWEGGNPIVFLDDLRAYYGLCGSNSRRRDLRHYFLFADNPSRIGRAHSAIFHGGRERRKDIRLLAEGSSVQIQNRESNVGVRSQ